MIVNLGNPQSIVAWFHVNPQRHGPQLAHFAKLWPQFSKPIAQAGMLLRTTNPKGNP